jgi:hypothetical protein
LAVLATEAKLLLNSYDATTIEMEQQAILEQLNATMNELYYAIQTVNRLDRRAEEYLSQGQNTESPDDLNGLLLRDDVDEDFHENFLNDHSEIFQRECDFEKTHSDYKPLRVWGTDETGNTVTPGEQVNFNAGNYMSLDQITTIFTGLRCVFDLVDPAVVKPTVDEYILIRKLSRHTISLHLLPCPPFARLFYSSFLWRWRFRWLNASTNHLRKCQKFVNMILR